MLKKTISILLTLCLCLVSISNLYANTPTSGAASCVASGHTSFSAAQVSGWPIVSEYYDQMTTTTTYYGKCSRCGGTVMSYLNTWPVEIYENWWVTCNVCGLGTTVNHTHNSYYGSSYTKCTRCGK